MKAPPLTIVTPTYNRAALLEKCYRSLADQDCFSFEWVVIDDGSTDDTKAVVSGILAKESRFEIIYVYKENGGKHTALNASHPYIHGKYVLILDSDDTLTPDAVSICLEGWKCWETYKSVGVLVFQRGYAMDDPFCYVLDENIPVDIMSYPRICIHSSDACEVVRSELFRQIPFPVFPGERFLSEGSFWGRLSFVCKCVYVNRVVYLCEYLEDGLTKSGRPLRIRNPLGGMDNANVYMAKKNRFKLRVKNGLLYTAYGFFAKKSPSRMSRECDHKAMMRLCLPFGWLLYRNWKRKWMRPNK